jgi:hypothetical protein
VTELAPADITVKVGGKSRAVTELTLKRVGASGAATPAAATPAAAAPASATAMAPSAPFATNDPSAAPPPPPAGAGRSILIVVDTESLNPGTESAVKAAIENLLKELTPADRIAFSYAPHDTAQVGFGSSVAVVRQAVANLHAQKVASSSTDEATAIAYCRTSDTLNLLKGLLQQAPGGDTPTSVVMIAASLSETGSAKSNTGGTCTVNSDQYQSIPAQAAAARANFYVVQGDPSSMGRDPGLENLAGATGAGAVLRVTNEGFAPKVLAESSAYWLATLAPDPSDKPNQSQHLEVKAVKEGVTVHARAEVMMSRPVNAAGAVPAPAGKSGASPKDMVGSSAPYTDLQLRAYAFAQRGTGDKMNVLVQAEPIDPSVKITAMKVGFFDAAGKGGAVDPPQIANYPITVGLPVGIGQYKIRVAATDSTGKSGAVDIKIDTTPVQAGPFKLSGLMLLLKLPDGKQSPKLLFSKGDTITAMFELYGVIPPAAEMIVGFEIAPSDTAPATKTFRPTGSAPTNEPDKLTVFGEIPVADLPPGDYVIRAVVQLKDNPMGKTIRTLRIK